MTQAVKIDAKTVMKLRAETGAGMMDCKKALKECEGDVEKAKAWLRKRGQKIAEKKATRETNAGQVASYIHAGGRIGVLLDLRCETDFVARTDDFQALAKDLCMHIAAANPVAVDHEGLDQDLVEKEKAIFREQVPPGKPDEVVEKIIEGKLGAFYKERCLLDQGFVKDPKTTIKDLLVAASAKLGENVQVGRFTRYEIGG